MIEAGVWYLLIFIFGAIVGSFLNVVIFRLNTGLSMVTGRSRCLNCGVNLRPSELVPIISYALQLGRCRSCRARISVQYIIVELLTAILFMLAFVSNGQIFNWMLVINWLIVSALMVIAVYDWRHKIIPNQVVYLFIGLSIATWLGRGAPRLDLIATLIAAGGFALLWFISRGRWLGLGDAKLVLGIGLVLGFPPLASALILAFWVGALVGLALIGWSRLSRVAQFKQLLGRRQLVTIKSEIPFAPFLILGMFLSWFWQINVFFF